MRHQQRITDIFLLVYAQEFCFPLTSIMANKKQEINRLLNEIGRGSEEAYSELFSMVYNQLHGLAHRQIINEPNLSLTKTALVHELYLKLFRQNKLDLEGKTHFFAIAARSMRQILIDYARKKKREKRGGKIQTVTYVDEIIKAEQEVDNLICIDQALNNLAEFDHRMAEIVELHYFGGLSHDHIAKLLNISGRTVYRDWATARGWLYKEIKKNLDA